MNDTIKKLQDDIAREERKISNCKHIYDKSFYNAETITEPYGYKSEAHGSDIYAVAEGYHKVIKDRWTRKCNLCGNLEHTYTQEPIISGYEPKF